MVQMIFFCRSTLEMVQMSFFRGNISKFTFNVTLHENVMCAFPGAPIEGEGCNAHNQPSHNMETFKEFSGSKPKY